jgi:agmatine deiminase
VGVHTHLELLPDWDTDCVTVVWPTAAMLDYARNSKELEQVYVAFVAELARHERLGIIVPTREACARLVETTGLPEPVFEIAEIPDIWIRDFAPLQSSAGLIKFVYDPPYARADVSRAVDRGIARYFAERGVGLRHSSIVLEGGQLVHNGAGLAIATDTIFARNPGRAPAELVAELEQLLGLERLLIVPSESIDRTGHVDGMLRFSDPHTLLVNDHDGLVGYVAFAESLERVLVQLPTTIRRVTVPYCVSELHVGDWHDARGSYNNFLLTRNHAYVPIFGGAADQRAIACFTALFGDRVSFIEASAVSTHGGVLNCISWNHRGTLG